MHHLLTLAAKEDIIEGLPEHTDLAGESSAAHIFTNCYITTNSAGTGWVWGKEAPPSPGSTMEEGEANMGTRVHQGIKRCMTMLSIQCNASPTGIYDEH